MSSSRLPSRSEDAKKAEDGHFSVTLHPANGSVQEQIKEAGRDAIEQESLDPKKGRVPER